MIKVLHVLTDTNVGGAGRYLFNLLSKWPSKNFDFIVACPGGGEMEKELKARNIKYISLTGGESSISLVHIKELISIIRRHKIDIVHTHASLSGRIAGRLTGSRVVLTRHGLSPVKNDAFHRFISWLVAKMFTDKIIAISRAVKINLIETGIPAEMITTIHNGIDLSPLENVEPILRKELGIAQDIPIIGIVARLVWQKGYEYAIKAMPFVLKRYPRAILVIIGDGHLKNKLQDLVKELSVEKNVLFLGYRRDVEKIMADFDVFVLPSISEGLGLSLLEAMALGKPVVATEVGGMPEVVKSGISGLLVAPKDSEALATGILKILSSKEMSRRMATAAKKTVYEKFSAQSMAALTEKLYTKILYRNGETP
jgi:glycosyltransferase involved in cell wall biosynthesis